MRQLVAEKLGKSEDDVQAMRGRDSLEQVELVMAFEEVFEELHR